MRIVWTGILLVNIRERGYLRAMDDFFDLSLDDLIKKYRIICEDEAKKLQLYDDDSSEQFTAVEKYNISSTRDDDDAR